MIDRLGTEQVEMKQMGTYIGETRNGIEVKLYATPEYDPTPRFTRSSRYSDILEFYCENGYAIISNVYSSEQCKSVRKSWQEVKRSERHLYRQASGFLEKNYSEYGGYITNPILNLQSLDPRFFDGLRNNFEDIILGSKLIAALASGAVEDDPLVVQSMYFEGNSVTWEHQDSYYLDDERIGKMVGVWIALEDIKADAGRFFVIPKSHKSDLSAMTLENSHTFNHVKYINSIVSRCKSDGSVAIAPALQEGDVLLWNSLTIHGSLQHTSHISSRSSITMHIIGNNSKLLSHRSFAANPHPKFKVLNNFYLYRPKDQSVLRMRIIYRLELFGSYFRKLKKVFNYLLIAMATLALEQKIFGK